MYQTIENTAYCLNYANEWPAVWDREPAGRRVRRNVGREAEKVETEPGPGKVRMSKPERRR